MVPGLIFSLFRHHALFPTLVGGKFARLRLVVAILFPVVAGILQWELKAYLPPVTWLFFYPAIFFSAWVGGCVGGLIATAESILLVIYFFTPVQLSWQIEDIRQLYKVVLFSFMGILYSLYQGRWQFSQAELNEAVELNQARMHMALNAVKTGLWEWTLRDYKVKWTENIWQLYGLPPHSCEPSIESWTTSIHPYDRERATEEIKNAVSAGRNVYLEWRVANLAEHDERWLMAIGEPELDDTGCPIQYHGIIIDISERKKLEKNLRENERLLADSQAIAHIGSWMVELPSNRIVWSKETFHLFGLSQGRDDIPSFDHFFLLIHNDDRIAVQGWIEDCQAGREVNSIEFRTRKINGTHRWLMACGRLENAANGLPWRLLGTLQDITERKNVDKEKSRIERRYYALVDQAAPDAMYVHDHYGRFVEVNQRACESVGYSKPELLGMGVFDIEADFDLAGAQAEWESIIPGVTKTLYGHHRRKDGNVFPVEVRFGLLEDKGQRLYIALVRDITKRKQAEAQMLLQTKALEAAANAIMITNPVGVIEWVNPAFTRLTGYTQDDSIGVTTDELFKCHLRHPEVHEKVWSTIKKGQIWQGEIEYQRKDGSFYMEEQTITPVLDEKDEIRHFIAIKQDITLRKQNQVELENYQDHLEQLVERRTNELQIARTQAEHLSQVKTNFLANMSHEIRSPMNAVLGFCYLLEQRSLDSESRQLVQKIHTAGNSLLALINDILDFSKIESGNLQIEHVPFQLSDVIDQLAVLMSGTAKDKNLELIIHPSPYDVENLIGDSLRIQQVLINLVSNAIKFTEKGEVELSIQVGKQHDDKVNLRFSVRDTGIGISPENQVDIFSAFTQADTSISRRFGGSGLGLTICHQLVTLMGGALNLDSRAGYGSTFWFDLTLARNPNKAQSPYSFSGLNVLIADDCEAARAALVSSANSLGCAVDAVDSGAAAYNQALTRINKKNPYDVLLLDWKMPGQDGLATAQAIKQAVATNGNNEVNSPIIIMVSSYSRDELLAQTGLDCIDSVLSKPVTPSSLYNTVTDVLVKRQPSCDLTEPFAGGKSNRLNGVRILVVDDSDINCEIAQRLLTFHGGIVYLTKDGEQALDWLKKNPDGVDIVLMDIQMPRMDGYEATRRIRQNKQWRQLPIVALSAGAFTTEQDSAKESGMNDFISKPFNVDQLLTVIKQQTTRKHMYTVKDYSIQNESVNPISSLANDMEVKARLLPHIDVDDAIRRLGGEDMYAFFLSKFVDFYANSGVEVAEHLRQGDSKAASNIVHKLKGTAGTLGLKSVAAQAYKIEQLLNSGAELNDNANQLCEAIRQACELIHGYTNKNNSVPNKQIANADDHKELKILLDQLLSALNDDTPSTVEPIMLKLQERISETELQPIQDQIVIFDFEAAKKLTEALIRKLFR